MAMTVTAISKKRNYNKKSVKFTLTGTEFPAAALTDVYLTHTGNSETISCNYSYVYGPTIVWVRFRLAGARKGLYDITVNYLGTLATLEDAFRVQ